MAVPTIPVVDGDVCIASVVCYDQEQISINALGYLIGGSAGGGATLQSLATALDTAVFAAYIALLNNQAFYLGVSARKFVGNKLSLPNTTKVNTGAGTAGADAMPRQATGMFTKQSALPGPAGRGRVYVPFPAVLDNGATPIPTAGYMVRLGTLAGILAAPLALTGPGTATATPVIIRYPRPAHVPPITLATVVWSTATARQKWATQRRRGSYGRPNVLPF